MSRFLSHIHVATLMICVAIPLALQAQQVSNTKSTFKVCELPTEAIESGCGAFYSYNRKALMQSKFIFATSQDSSGMAICVNNEVRVLKAVNGRKLEFSDDIVVVKLNIKYDKMPEPRANEGESVGASGNMHVIYKGAENKYKIIGHEGC